MPVVKFPGLMKYYVDNQTEISLEAVSVKNLFEVLLVNYPALRPHMFDSEGQLRRHFNIFVNGVHIRELEGMDTELSANDVVILMASAAGG